MSKNSKKHQKTAKRVQMKPKARKQYPGYNVNLQGLLKEEWDTFMKFANMEGFQPTQDWVMKIIPAIEKIVMKYHSHVNQAHLLALYSSTCATNFVMQTMKSIVQRAKGMELAQYLQQQGKLAQDKVKAMQEQVADPTKKPGFHMKSGPAGAQGVGEIVRKSNVLSLEDINRTPKKEIIKP
jgi:hypothetical protein